MPRTTGATSLAFKSQYIAIATFSSILFVVVGRHSTYMTA